MKTTQELHIALDILLQKVSSNWNKNFLPQEKDFFINREITKFLKQRTNPLSNNKRLSMYDSLKRIMDVNTLLKSEQLPVMNINQKEVDYRLPFDFLYYVRSNITVSPLCKGDTFNNATTTPKIEYNKSFKPLTTYVGLTQCNLTLTYNSEVIVLFDMANLPSYYLPQDNIEDYKKIFIINDAINTLARLNVPEGVEFRFNNTTQSFEVRSDETFTLSFTVNLVAQPIITNDIVYSVVVSNKNFKSNVEIIDEEYSDLIQSSYLSSTKGKVTKGQLRANSIIVQNSDSVLVKSAYLTYIRKPTNINLLLNINSELPDEILDEVISNVAESLKAVISSDTYEKYSKDNLMIE